MFIVVTLQKNIVINMHSTKIYTMDEADARKIFEEIRYLKKEHEKLKEENEQLKKLLEENSIIVPSKVLPQHEESKLKMERIPNKKISKNEILKRKKKEKEEDIKKEDSLFNFDEFIKNYECSETLKYGFKFYIKNKALKINSEKEFEKEFDKYKNIESNIDENSDFDAEVDDIDFKENYHITDNFVDDYFFEDMNEYEDTSNNLHSEPMFQKERKSQIYEKYKNNIQLSTPTNTRKEIIDNSLVTYKEEKNDMSIISFLARSNKRVQILKSLVDSDKIPSIISKEIGDSNHHVSKYLKNLKEKGLVICLNENDKRFRFYSITPKGKKYLKIMEDKNY